MKDETKKLLKAAVTAAMNPVESKVEDTAPSDARIDKIEKALGTLVAKFDVIAEHAVLELPETPEQKMNKMSEAIADIAKTVETLAKAKTETTATDENAGEQEEVAFPKTAEELTKMISGAVEAALKDVQTKVEAPKGSSKDAKTEEAPTPVEKKIDFSHIEKTDPNGNERSDEQRADIAEVDDHIAKIMTGEIPLFGSEELNIDLDLEEDEED